MAIIDNTPISLLAGAATTKWRFGKISSGKIINCSVAGERADGIVGTSATAADQALDFQVERVMKVESGASYSAGDPLTTDSSGRAITATGSAYINAYALEAAAAAGEYHACIPARAMNPLAANVSNSQTGVGALVCYTFSIADAASADYDRTIAEKFEVLDVIVQKRGGAGGASATVTVKNAADAITDAIDINDADTTLSRAATIDDAYSTVAAGGTLRCSVVDGGNSSILVTVIGVKRA